MANTTSLLLKFYRCSITHTQLVKLNTLLNCLDMSMVVDHLSINVDMNEEQNMAGGIDPEFKVVSTKRLRSKAVDSQAQQRSLRSDQNSVVKNVKKVKTKKIVGDIYRCKICSLPLNMKSRFKVAHHMYSVHYKDKIQEDLCGSRECSLCGKEFTSEYSAARHFGETHEVATTLYETDTGSKLWGRNTTSPVKYKDLERIKKSKSECLEQTIDKQEMKFVRTRIRSSIYSKPKLCQHPPGEAIFVEVVQDVPEIEDLILDDIESDEIDEVIDEDVSLSRLSSRLLIHGRNSVPWKIHTEEYSECVMGCVEKGRMRNIGKQGTSTDEAKFFHLWNEFMLEYGYIGAIGRIHMRRVMEGFIEERGKQVMQEKLYRQFVTHLVLLEREAVLPKGQLLRLASKIQDVQL